MCVYIYIYVYCIHTYAHTCLCLQTTLFSTSVKFNDYTWKNNESQGKLR